MPDLIRHPEQTEFTRFRRKPESSSFGELQILWAPVFTGVTTSYEIIKSEYTEREEGKSGSILE
jgi:hypothetical protein